MSDLERWWNPIPEGVKLQIKSIIRKEWDEHLAELAKEGVENGGDDVIDLGGGTTIPSQMVVRLRPDGQIAVENGMAGSLWGDIHKKGIRISVCDITETEKAYREAMDKIIREQADSESKLVGAERAELELQRFREQTDCYVNKAAKDVRIAKVKAIVESTPATAARMESPSRAGLVVGPPIQAGESVVIDGTPSAPVAEWDAAGDAKSADA